MRTRSQRYKALTENEKQLVREIPHIEDVDFVPSEKESYERLPEPFRSEALIGLENRKNNFAINAQIRKESFA